MAEQRKGSWASLTPDADELARGLVDSTTTVKIYKDGTFTTQSAFGRESARDRLICLRARRRLDAPQVRHWAWRRRHDDRRRLAARL